MSHSSMDVLSSPDPLNESQNSSAAPWSRRVTRSQRTQRFSSLSNPSPRKQTFELDVGNEISPQKILVTVEADEGDTSNVSRRLFQSPAPRSIIRRKERTTTTTVPLRDDDGQSATATPKPRGRPRRSGTPTPASRKRAATPTQKTPRRTRKTKSSEDEPMSELSIASTHATEMSSVSKKTPRKGAKASAKKVDAGAAQSSQPRKRGRPRRQALAPEEVQAIADQDTQESTIIVFDPSESAEPEAPAYEAGSHRHNFTRGDTNSNPQTEQGEDDMEEDIWMAQLSQPPTPLVSRKTSASEQAHPQAHQQLAESANDVSELPVEHPLDLGPSEADGIESEAAMDVDDHSDLESQSEENIRAARREQDTVANGEDFSMISIGSVPSFQAKISAHEAGLPEMGDTTSLIVSRTLESLRQSKNDAEEALADFQLPDTPDAPSSSHIRTSAGRSTRSQTGGPLFSQPASPEGWSRSPRRNKNTPLSRQLAMKSLIKGDLQASSHAAGSPSRAPLADSPRRVVEDVSMYEDSFSEIPEAVLEAATPKRPRTHHLELDDEMEALLEDEPEYMELEYPASSKSITSTMAQVPEENRLLTPEETPSPAGSSSHDATADEMLKSAAVSVMRSSPPVFNIPQQPSILVSSRHSRHSSTETPTPKQLSPQLPAPPAGHDIQPNNLSVSVVNSRPTLSPIVRAGRALQNVTSDPPSPIIQEKSLGSPFRSSGGESAQSPTISARKPVLLSGKTSDSVPEPQPSSAQAADKSWSKAFAPFNQLRSLVVQGAHVFSPRSNAAVVTHASSPQVTAVSGREEPQSLHTSVHSGDDELRFNPASVTSSTKASPPSEDGMDWEAAAEAPRATDQNHMNSVSSIFATRGSTEMPDFGAGDDADIEDQHNNASHHDTELEDDDLWAIEARRTARGSLRAPAAPEPVNPPRRGKLPSPWRKSSKGMLYSDETDGHNHSIDCEESSAVEDSRRQEFSLLSHQANNDVSNQREEEVPVRPGKVDLSAFFSSPTLLPPMQRTAPEVSKVPQIPPRSVATSLVQESQPRAHVEQPLPLSQRSLRSRDRLPSISQKIFEPANIDRPPIPQKGFQPSIAHRKVDLFSPAKAPHVLQENLEPDHPTSPSTPEQPVLAHIPQKRNFTPLLSKTSQSLFASKPAPVLVAPTLSTVPLHDPFTEDHQHDTSMLSQESSFVAPELKPLPAKSASPTKSCLRSPLKPRTPGRVVEFTSSVLSPLAQAQARAERSGLVSGLTSWGQSFATSTTTRPEVESEPMDGVEADKENTENGHANSPPKLSLFSTPKMRHLQQRRSEAPSPSPLSQASWSRAHWLRLDALLQARRNGGALNFQLKHPVASAQKRKSTTLLGKDVTAQGETMTLEQWHLDVVDAFREEVGGWEEGLLAKRVFALLVGEERRRLGLVPRRR